MGSCLDHIKKYDPGKYERCLKISEHLKEKFLNLLEEGKAIILYRISSGWYSQPSANNILRLWKEGEKILYIRNRKTSVVTNPSASIFNRKSEERWGECSGEVHEISMFEYPQHEVIDIRLFEHGFTETTENGVKIPSRFDFHLAEAFRFKKDSFYKMKCFPDKESMNLYYEIMKEELS